MFFEPTVDYFFGGPEGSRTLFFVYLLTAVTGQRTNRYAPRPKYPHLEITGE